MTLRTPREMAAETPRDPDADTREMRALLTEVRNRHGRHFSALETQRIDALLKIGAKRRERGI